LVGLLSSMLKKPQEPGGAPGPSSDTAHQGLWATPSQSPANTPLAGTSAFGGLTVNYNPQGLNVMGQPQVQQGITDALHSTSATALVGGGGIGYV
jgi:hypothetical protein